MKHALIIADLFCKGAGTDKIPIPINRRALTGTEKKIKITEVRV